MTPLSAEQLRFLADALAAPHSPASESCNKVARRLRKKADEIAAAPHPPASKGGET